MKLYLPDIPETARLFFSEAVSLVLGDLRTPWRAWRTSFLSSLPTCSSRAPIESLALGVPASMAVLCSERCVRLCPEAGRGRRGPPGTGRGRRTSPLPAGSPGGHDVHAHSDTLCPRTPSPSVAGEALPARLTRFLPGTAADGLRGRSHSGEL